MYFSVLGCKVSGNFGNPQPEVFFLNAGYGLQPNNSKREYNLFRFPERFPSTYERSATEMNFLALVMADPISHLPSP